MKLSKRQLQAIKLAAKGYNQAEMAQAMGCTCSMAVAHIRSAKHNLNAKNIAHAVYIAVTDDII